MTKKKRSDREVGGKQKNEPWKHSTSKKEVSALKAMMQKSVQSLKEKSVMHSNRAESAGGFSLTTARAEIEKENRIFMALVSSGDAAGLADCFTADAKFMSPGAPAVVGRADIQKAMSEILESGITGLDTRVENIYGTADLIATEGELTLFVDGNAVSEEKYIALWKKEDGRWKMFRDIFNSNQPEE
ncbi:MAG: nuclear transport factor 2 family protein [Bacteroidetes bacterium]|nr:nuclear transport factor 2 family protein [Bacteroidota bacterium]MCH8524528.1 nuclear transport factor 2 family protein [Balneolales bacterium]